MTQAAPRITQDAPATHRIRDGEMCPWYACDAQAAQTAKELGFEVERIPHPPKAETHNAGRNTHDRH